MEIFEALRYAMKKLDLIEGNRKPGLEGGAARWRSVPCPESVRGLVEEKTAAANWRLVSETVIVTLRSRASATRACSWSFSFESLSNSITVHCFSSLHFKFVSFL